ncbi:MAG: globin [Deltaproteobacteria bacterium]|nr:MAG: globin [Deltaproteobacteria bacterium]TNF24396.1 MAG: globin [Deltaproteobacteria bacterium]
MKARKKSWEEKVDLVKDSYYRAASHKFFAERFYKYLFYLKPSIKEYFKNTDFEKQEEVIIDGLDFMFGYISGDDKNARVQFLRLCKTHNKKNMNIHPHNYYYWIEALIMAGKECDANWHDDLEYYWREVVSFPVMFMSSMYLSDAE